MYIIRDKFNVNIFQEYNSSLIALLNPYLVGFAKFIGKKSAEMIQKYTFWPEKYGGCDRKHTILLLNFSIF